MAGNNIELITTYSPKMFDLAYRQEAMSSMLDANPKLVKFEGTKTVKIGKWQNGGLHDYYRNNFGDDRVRNTENDGSGVTPNFAGSAGFGYQKSAGRLTWEEFTMKCDRAAEFQIEKFDAEESGDEIVGLAVAEVTRTAIVPEVDAYCFSTIASYCSTQLGNLVAEDLTGATAKPLAALNKCFAYFANHEVPIKDQLVFCSPDYMKALRETTEVTKFLGQTDFNNKDINFLITSYEGRKLIEVSPERLRTGIELFGNEGYRWGTDSKKINFLAVSKEAVTHVVKYNQVKVLEGDIVLSMGYDGYAIFARVYHDVFVPDNKRIGLYCSVVSTAVAAPAVALDVAVKDGKIKSLTVNPGSVLAFVGTDSGSTGTGASNAIQIGDTLAENKFTVSHVGDACTTTTTFYAVDSNRKVLAIQKITIA